MRIMTDAPWESLRSVRLFDETRLHPVLDIDGFSLYTYSLFSATLRPVACRRCQRELSLRGLLLHWRAHHTFGLKRPR